MNPVNKQANKLGLMLVAAMLGPTLYWGYTYSGPYRYLAELQLKWFGVYYPEVTGLTIILGMLCVVGAVKFLFRGAERAVPGAPTAATPDHPAMTAAVEQRWLRYLPYLVVPVFAGMGAHDYYKGTRAGGLQKLNASDFYNGKLQASLFYADIRGRLSSTYLSKDQYFYAPIRGEEKMEGPIRLLVGGSKNDIKKSVRREADGTVSVWGIVDKGLDGDVKYAFEKNGYAVSDTVWVVHAGRAPSDERGLGLFMMGFGVASAGLIFGIQRFKDRKRTATKPAQATA